tara:strand:- start:352 stop:804 length:453 start_codon:yes stop_codon:yes gene_type:complete
MIDPFTAFAIAQSAVAGIKQAFALGQDIQGVAGDLTKFFDAKDEVFKAIHTSRSDSATAMDLAIKASNLAQQEKEIREYLIYTGQGDIWEDFLFQRNKIMAARKADELRARLAIEKKKKERDEMLELVFWSVFGFLVCGAIISLTFALLV